MNAITERDCRERAAKFCLGPLTGEDNRWIESGDDEIYTQESHRNVEDICELAQLLWQTVRDDRKGRSQ